MKIYVTPKEASRRLGITSLRLRTYGDEGHIDVIRTPRGQRRYDVESYIAKQANEKEQTLCYCQVIRGRVKLLKPLAVER